MDPIFTAVAALAILAFTLTIFLVMARQRNAANLRFKTALANMAQGLVMFDRDQRLVLCNAQYMALFKLPPELGRPGTPMADILACSFKQQGVEAGDTATYIERRLGLARLPEPWSREIHFDDGRVVEVNRNVMADGGSVVTFDDVTARVRAEAALRDSESQLNLVADSLPVVIVYIDREERYGYVNATFERWHDCPRADAIGKFARHFTGEANYPQVHERIAHALAGNRLDYERTVTYPDGITRDIEGMYVPDFGPDGIVRGAFLLVYDVSERKRAEAELRDSESQLRLVTDSLPAIIVYIDRQEHFRYVNATFELWHGRARADTVGKHVRDIVGDADLVVSPDVV